VTAGAAAEATHHARDLSGADGDPAAPRLFSPPLFASASPRVGVVRDAGLAGRLEADAGPAVQLTTGADASVRLGGDVRLALSQRFGDRLQVGVAGRAERVADVYRRFELSARAALLF
jgi:hypothetical protein